MATPPRLDPYVRLSRPGYTRYDLQYDEWRRQLRGLTGIKTRREMARSPYGALILRAATLVYRRLNWRVDPASEARADQDAAAYLETCLHDLNQPWPNFINQVVAGVFEQGYALFEITYKVRRGEQDPESDYPTSKYDDNKIGWRGLDFIPPETVVDDWDIPLGRSWQGAWQQPPEGGRVYLPKTKLLLFRLDDRTGSPVGSGGVFDDMYRAWHYLTELQRIDGITRERHGGIPLIKLPPGATTDTNDPTSDWYLARQAVEQFQVNEQSGFVVPDGWDVQILSPGEGSKDMQAALDGYKRDFFMGALAQWAMLGASSVGSYSLSKDQTDFYVMALEGWLGSFVQVLNEVAVSRLFALNPFPGLTGYPRLAHDPITRRDGLSFADTLTKLAAGWVTPTPEDEEFLRREYELPERTAADIQAEQADMGKNKGETAPTLASDVQTGIVRKNERRAQLGLEPLPEDKAEAMRSELLAQLSVVEAATKAGLSPEDGIALALGKPLASIQPTKPEPAAPPSGGGLLQRIAGQPKPAPPAPAIGEAPSLSSAINRLGVELAATRMKVAEALDTLEDE